MIDQSVNKSSAGPVVNALTAIAVAAGKSVLGREHLEAWHTESYYDLAVFSYARDFAALWGLNNENEGLAEIVSRLTTSQQNDDGLTLLIVWDGMPEVGDMGAVNSYVTPYDWAVALSVCLYNQNNNSVKLRILILDIASQRSEKSFIQQSFFAFHNVFPWIQDYRPVASADLSNAEISLPNDAEFYSQLRQAVRPEQRGSDRLICDLRDFRYVLTTFSAEDGIRCRDHLSTVVESWKQQFMRAGDRHAIANLTAPFILAGGLPDRDRENAQALIGTGILQRQALCQLLKVVGLFHTNSVSCSSPQPLLFKKGGVFGRRKKVRFLLVDDQFHQGYHYILAAILFRNNYDVTSEDQKHWRCEGKEGLGSLSCEISADSIIKKLTEKGKVKDWNLPRDLSEILKFDVLLLDLRLWATEDEKLQFIKKLIAACKILNVGELKHRHESFRDAYETGKNICSAGKQKEATEQGEDKRQKDSSEIPALVLFSLLLSYYDPSFPIVLFSSTHQRDVVEMVSHRPNIITYFSKPIMSGYGEEDASNKLVGNLYKSLEKALKMHENRIIWKRLNSLQVNMPAWINNGKYVSSLDKNRPFESTQDWKRGLTCIYEHYIVREQYYDFISVPWEFIDGSYLDTRQLNPSKKGEETLASGLHLIRNRKTHGRMLLAEENWGNPDLQTCVLLEFLILLDIISGEKTENNQQEDWWTRCSNYIKYKDKTRFISVPRDKKLEAYELKDSGSIKHGEFICLSIFQASYHDYTYLSEETATVFENVINNLCGTANKSIHSNFG